MAVDEVTKGEQAQAEAAAVEPDDFAMLQQQQFKPQSDRAQQQIEHAVHTLAAAEVVVEDVERNPGYYSSRFYLRPHYQLEGLTVSLRLVSKLPSVKG